MTALPCPRVGKLIRGCRFEARYEYGRPEKWEFGWGTNADEAEQLMLASRARHYIRDVCRTCGRTIERSHPTHSEQTGG